ncbi:MAG: citrate/2-methylcitrate synthase [Thermoplasmata archaeon]|nr:citrate/2-methylcitrate synthase [Thermoplasmata archaeon]
MNASPEPVGVGDTAITGIDGGRGVLTYRGFRIEDVVAHLGYEQVVRLLLSGHRPDETETQEVQSELRARRDLPPTVERVLESLPEETPPIDGLRTTVSAMDDVARVYPPTLREALELVARGPTLVARLFRQSTHASFVAPDQELGHVANYLWMVQGTRPPPERVRALERYFVLLGDHGISASTFALRIVLSTRSDLASAVSAALGALKGPLHGGAPPEVLEMLDAVGSIDQVEAWIDRTLDQRGRLYGFGHPTYRVEDPRATLLRSFAQEVAPPDRYALARRFEEVALERLTQRRPDQPLFTNVDFYGAVLLEGVGLPRPLFTPTFALARTAGWGAHALEQVAQNRLVRPPERYTGPSPRSWSDET